MVYLCTLRRRAVLTAVKSYKPLWLTLTRGPSLFGSLPSGDTGKRLSPGRQ